MGMRSLTRTLSVLFLGTIPFITACSDVAFKQGEQGSRLGGDLPDPDVGFTRESFVQKGSEPEVDILMVVDNSMSMAEEQLRLGERMGTFLSFLRDVDWRLAITTTDVSNGNFGLKGDLLSFGTTGPVLTKNTVNFNQLFLNTVVRPETALCNATSCPVSGDEQPLFASILAMEKSAAGFNNFIRPTADLALVYLTDEDEMSTGPANATKPEQVLSAVRTLWGSLKKVDAYGIIIQPGDTACEQAQALSGGSAATHVANLVRLTRGITGSICDSDYGATLGVMGQRVRRLLDTVQLSRQPLAGSVKVTLVPEQPGVAWTLEERTIRFAPAPVEGTQIHVDFK